MVVTLSGCAPLRGYLDASKEYLGTEVVLKEVRYGRRPSQISIDFEAYGGHTNKIKRLEVPEGYATVKYFMGLGLCPTFGAFSEAPEILMNNGESITVANSDFKSQIEGAQGRVVVRGEVYSPESIQYNQVSSICIPGITLGLPCGYSTSYSRTDDGFYTPNPDSITIDGATLHFRRVAADSTRGITLEVRIERSSDEMYPIWFDAYGLETDTGTVVDATGHRASSDLENYALSFAGTGSDQIIFRIVQLRYAIPGKWIVPLP